MSAPASESAQLFFEGNRHLAEGDHARARTCFEAALALAPDFAEAHANLAFLCEQRGEPDRAEQHYRRACALWPDGVQLCINFGGFLLKGKHFDEAGRILARATELAPGSAQAWSNRGVLLACLQREQEAEQAYRRALDCDAGYRKARFNLSYLLLRQGRFQEGWAMLEARPRFAPLESYFNCPHWHGEALHGKRIVLGFEGGHGDMIQFCRYAAELKRRGAAEVAVLCDPALVRLFGTLDGAGTIYSNRAPMPTEGWDFWCLPMSLPLYCGTTLATIPAALPYLAPDPALLAAWAARLPARAPDQPAPLRIGLCWQGNRLFENDADRSLADLAPLAPLAALPGLHWISLQKGDGTPDASTPAGMTLTRLGDALDDFADTAAVIAQLDLVISIDSAVAHLAASLGKPCWLLLPHYRPDWRWLSGRDDSPWYPGVLRLFRQPRAGDWNEPVMRMQAALQALLAAPASQGLR